MRVRVRARATARVRARVRVRVRVTFWKKKLFVKETMSTPVEGTRARLHSAKTWG